MTDKVLMAGTVKLRAYRVVRQAVERGVRNGVLEAHSRGSQATVENIADAVMVELDGLVIWPEL